MSTRLDCLDLVPRLRGARWWGGRGGMGESGMCNCQPLLFVACLKAFLTDLHPMLGEKVEYATIVVEGHKMPIIIFLKN